MLSFVNHDNKKDVVFIMPGALRIVKNCNSLTRLEPINFPTSTGGMECWSYIALLV